MEVAMKTDWTSTHYGSEEGHFALDGVEERGGRVWAFAQFHRSRSHQQISSSASKATIDSGVRVAECLVSRLM